MKWRGRVHMSCKNISSAICHSKRRRRYEMRADFNMRRVIKPHSRKCNNPTCRYFSSPHFLSPSIPKTLNPFFSNAHLHSNPSQKHHFLLGSSSGSLSFPHFGSYPIQEKQSLHNSSSGYRSFLQFGSYSVQKKQSLCNFSSGSSPSFGLGSYSLQNRQFLCTFSSGSYSNVGTLMGSQFFGSSSIYSHIINFRCSVPGSLNLPKFHSGNLYKCFSVSSSGLILHTAVEDIEVPGKGTCTNPGQVETRKDVLRKFVSLIVDLIRNDGKDLESRLSMVGSKFTVETVSDIFDVLNSEKVSGLRFFKWLHRNNCMLRRNADICSLIIDNCGRLDDDETMFELLKQFKYENICLTDKAFRFLPVLASTEALLKESVQRVLLLLNTIGSSCRNSGVHALIEMFCKLDLYEMAKYVIQTTESKDSYCHLIIREKCRRGPIEDVRGVVGEMRKLGFLPDAKVYSYLIGNLCTYDRMDEALRLFKEMKEVGISPDASTYDVLINFLCRGGNMKFAYELLDDMVSMDLEPKLATHFAIIKSLFAIDKYEEACNYVADASITYTEHGNMMYSSLASLYQAKGDTQSSYEILVEMMEKGLVPNFSSYKKTVNQLKRTGKGDLAKDLLDRRSKFVTET